MKRPTRKWWRMAEIYKLFTGEQWDFSQDAAEAMYRHESLGERTLLMLIGEGNGFAIGKHWKDWHVEQWCNDGWFTGVDWRELYADGIYPHWWLDKIKPPGISKSLPSSF